MQLGANIFVAGSNGLVGSALVRNLRRQGYGHLLTPRRRELDLTRQELTLEFFRKERPEYVFLAAAKVGGILANSRYPADFIYENLNIQCNVIRAAHEVGVERLLFLGSSCIYPKHAPQPLREDSLLTGELEPTNEPYAVAKIAGIKMCQAFNRQHGTSFLSVMPTNLYGPGDNFDLESSHVLPALLRKFHEAKENGDPEVVVWGTGVPRREFLHVNDLAEACIFIMNLKNDEVAATFLDPLQPSFVNVGWGSDISIRDLAEMIREIVGFNGRLKFDTTKPDGTPRKILDVTRMRGLGWKASIELKAGIEATYRWFLDQRKGA